MVTLVGTESDLGELLEHLRQVDLDAMEAYDLAMGNAEDTGIREQFESFKNDHIRHADALAALLVEIGREPSGEIGSRSIGPFDAVVAASIVGDRALLERLRSSEEDTNTAYERALKIVSGNDRAEGLLRGNLEDERRHRRWLEQTLARL